MRTVHCLALVLLLLSGCTSTPPAPEETSQEVLDCFTDVSGCETLAQAGDADAQNFMGVRSQLVAQDYAEAARWWRLAAEQGHADAQNALGELYFAGAGVAQDDREGQRWFRLAAEQGHAVAQYNLGAAYVVGRGVAQSEAVAADWFRRAAAQGNANAQFYLGSLYASGKGVPQNDERAYLWLRVAAEQMPPGAMASSAAAARDSVSATLTPQRRTEVDALAATCRASEFKDCGEAAF